MIARFHPFSPPCTRLLFGIVAVLAWQVAAVTANRDEANDPAGAGVASVFDMPARLETERRLAAQAGEMLRRGEFAESEEMLAALVRSSPFDASGHQYNLACARARQDKGEQAIAALRDAVEGGFHDAAHMQADPDLESLRERPDFQALLARARALREAEPGSQRLVTALPEPGAVRDGIAMIDEHNTVFDPGRGLFVVRHSIPAATETVACRGLGAPGELVQQWFAKGTAAGLHGVLYDNHDNDHSTLDHRRFPQLIRTRYSDQAKGRGLHAGLQSWFLHDVPLLGNASMAATAGPYWASLPRVGLRQGALASVMARQYSSNQLYFYPEHRDHDVDGHGDLYPANTPYWVLSQGSSGSDRPFMHALALTLAAFPPATQRSLFERRLMCPTLQMILRRCQKSIQTDDDYLTGRAHPTAFDERELNVERMVAMAHALTSEQIPTTVLIRALDEDVATLGIDYFEVGPAERLLDSPHAIARIGRALRRERRMRVQATPAPGGMTEPVSFHWKLLRGDPERVELRPTEDGRECEIVVQWHERRPIEEGSPLLSTRVDVGVFLKAGEHFSAPSFVSWHFPANEERTYRDDGRLAAVEFHRSDVPARYVDPAIVTPAVWRDEFQYDHGNRWIGWKRSRGVQEEFFTKDGALITERNKAGQPLAARVVRYIRKQATAAHVPELIQEATDEIIMLRAD